MKLSVRTKLLGSSAILIVFMLAIGLLAIVNLGTANDLAGKIGRRDHDFEFALEAVIESFSYLHRHILCLLPLYTAPMGLRRQAPLTEAVQTGGVPGRA